MRTLFFGAGPLGSVYAHLLHEKGADVTVLARGDRYDWIKENEEGRPWFNEKRRLEQDHMIERVGAELRNLMPFVNPVTVKPGE